MAQFNLKWINSLVLGNSNSAGQKALYRQKSVGGTWLETGFSLANPLPTYTSEIKSPVLGDNKIWEFKIQCLCTQGGPVDNDNGVQEALKFSCITPTTEKTETTSKITANVTGLDITKVRFTLRKVSDNSIVHGPLTIEVDPVTHLATTTATGLSANTQYYWQTVLYANLAGVELNSAQVEQLGNVCGPYLVTTEGLPVQNLVWIADATACEKEGGFGLEKTISGVSSPNRAWYDPQTSKVFVTDNDDSINGNIYWFNPDTATSSADMVHSITVKDNEIYNTYIDGPKRKIYLVGRNTGGLLVYDIDTDTTSVVAFGTNAAYSRITLTVSDNYIYCNDASNSIVIIDRNTLTISSTKTISTITNPEHFNTDVQFVVGNSKLYAINSNNGVIGTIGVYSLDLNTHHSEISLPGASTWSGGGGTYWQNGFYDSVSGHLYIGDIGSSTRHIIDTTTDTVINSKTMGNKAGKSNVRSFWTTNPITGELLYLYAAMNTSADASPISRTYVEDRVTYALTRMYENQSYNGLSHIVGSSRLVGVNPGGVYWNGITTPDGTIQILNNAIAGGNTGKKIVLTLKEVDANNANTPTGQTKNNVQGDANYIAPYTDNTACAITYTLDCPVDQVTTFAGGILEWEFSVASAVKNNPSIAKIQVYAYNITSSAIEGVATEFLSPYDYHLFSGQFTGLAGSNYTIRIKYLDNAGVELKAC